MAAHNNWWDTGLRKCDYKDGCKVTAPFKVLLELRIEALGSSYLRTYAEKSFIENESM